MTNTAGKIMPIPRGEYVSISVYNILDMVRYGNSLWMAKKNQLKNVTPSKENSDSWMLILEESDGGELGATVTELQDSVFALTSKIAALEDLIAKTSQGVKVIIGDSEPTDCNVLWYNTNYQNNITDSIETVMLDIGEVTDESVLSIQVNDEDYSITNTETPQQVDDETYSFIINY